MQTPLAAVWLYHVQFKIFEQDSIHSNANSNTQVQFQSFERNFEKLECNSNSSNSNLNHSNANLRWLWRPRSALGYRVQSAAEPHLFCAMATLRMSAVFLHNFRSNPAIFLHNFRSNPAVLPVFRIVSALFSRSFCTVPAAWTALFPQF